MLASPLLPASPRAEIATLPFLQTANGEKPYRARYPRRIDIPNDAAPSLWSNHLACVAPPVYQEHQRRELA
jgi:hypothetical protein